MRAFVIGAALSSVVHAQDALAPGNTGTGGVRVYQELGHDVTLGARHPNSIKLAFGAAKWGGAAATDWLKGQTGGAAAGSEELDSASATGAESRSGSSATGAEFNKQALSNKEVVLASASGSGSGSSAVTGTTGAAEGAAATGAAAEGAAAKGVARSAAKATEETAGEFAHARSDGKIHIYVDDVDTLSATGTAEDEDYVQMHLPKASAEKKKAMTAAATGATGPKGATASAAPRSSDSATAGAGPTAATASTGPDNSSTTGIASDTTRGGGTGAATGGATGPSDKANKVKKAQGSSMKIPAIPVPKEDLDGHGHNQWIATSGHGSTLLRHNLLKGN